MSLSVKRSNIWVASVSVFGAVDASAALRRCCERYRDGHAEEAREGVLSYLSVSNTINIITYTDV